jgi:hypothetical protein
VLQNFNHALSHRFGKLVEMNFNIYKMDNLCDLTDHKFDKTAQTKFGMDCIASATIVNAKKKEPNEDLVPKLITSG